MSCVAHRVGEGGFDGVAYLKKIMSVLHAFDEATGPSYRCEPHQVVVGLEAPQAHSRHSGIGPERYDCDSDAKESEGFDVELLRGGGGGGGLRHLFLRCRGWR